MKPRRLVSLIALCATLGACVSAEEQARIDARDEMLLANSPRAQDQAIRRCLKDYMHISFTGPYAQRGMEIARALNVREEDMHTAYCYRVTDALSEGRLHYRDLDYPSEAPHVPPVLLKALATPSPEEPPMQPWGS